MEQHRVKHKTFTAQTPNVGTEAEQERLLNLMLMHQIFGALEKPLQKLFWIAYQSQDRQTLKELTEQIREATGGYLP